MSECSSGSWFEDAIQAGFVPEKAECLSQCFNDFSDLAFIGSGMVGHILWAITVIICVCSKCLWRDGRRFLFIFTSFYTSILITLQLIYLFSCGSEIILFYVVEYTIACLILTGTSRTWNHLKNIKGNTRDGQRFIRRQLTAVPEIQMKIECYHYKETSARDSRGNRSTSRDKVVSFSKTELLPYTTWWIEGDLSHTETLIETHQGKFTFVSLDYSVLVADDFTKKSIEDSRKEIYHNYKHKDDHCDVTVNLYAETGVNKFALKKDNMEIPWFCKSSNFWLCSLLPLPFFNGALIRWYVNKQLSIDERRNIVRFVVIRPGYFNQIKPPSDSSRGFQQENSRFEDDHENELSFVENKDNQKGFEDDFEFVSNNSSSVQPSAPPAPPEFHNLSFQDDNNIPPPYAN